MIAFPVDFEANMCSLLLPYSKTVVKNNVGALRSFIHKTEQSDVTEVSQD